MNKLIIFLFSLFLVFPVFVTSECTCEKEVEERNKTEALKYKLVAVASILIAGAIGVSFMVLGKIIPAFHPENGVFFVIKAFAAGVILATGFVHVLPDAFESLSSPCLNQNPWGNFPFSGLIAMLSGIGTMMVDVFVTSYCNRKHLNQPQPLNIGDEEKRVNVNEQQQQQQHKADHLHVHTHATHGHAHGSAYPEFHDSKALDLIRRRIISQILELGIVVHSVIIGMSLGASMSPKTIKPLVVALTFHQLFEGMGLGSCISQAKFKARTIATMAIFFCMTTPVGIAIGFGISNIYDENSATALIVEGTLNSASAGILIYMALVDVIAVDFMSPKMQSNLKLQIESNLSLLLGAGCMSLLAKWA